ncbi:hypothetical protein KM043_012852 [Ampulex compressa]|nr:hypothetical protein KM043_012852 [Ampulex compressa]
MNGIKRQPINHAVRVAPGGSKCQGSLHATLSPAKVRPILQHGWNRPPGLDNRLLDIPRTYRSTIQISFSRFFGPPTRGGKSPSNPVTSRDSHPYVVPVKKDPSSEKDPPNLPFPKDPGNLLLGEATLR